ncbi:Gldg family protein [Tundrisphaera sp. TA3]|uniref:GldG family protein n=1 Tax=Tundrisphaera sp. TA3 TaxID=3435775 RepID=UPI003EB6EA22
MMFLSRIEVWASFLGLAAFLALFWMIRGAPVGQKARDEPDADAPGPGYRDRLIVATVIGFLLIVAGAFLFVASGVPASLAAFTLGFGTILVVIRTAHRHRHSSPTIRRVLRFSNTALTASLLGGILVVANVFAFKYGGRAIDLTRDRAYSLESLTLNQLTTLEKPVTIIAFHGNSEGSVRRLERIIQLLDQFKTANPRDVRVETLDVIQDAREFEALVKRYPDVAATPGDGVVVIYGEGETAPHAVLGTGELFERSASRFDAKSDRFVSTFHGEDAITSAIVRLREGKRSKVAFATGHGEASIQDVDPRQPGPGIWKGRMSAMGTDAVEVNLLHDDIPVDAGIVVVAGPKTPLQTEEVDRIKAFIGRGGCLIVLVGNAGPSGLEELLRNYNVEVGPGQIVDPTHCLEGRPGLIYAPILAGSNHPVVDTLQTRWALLPGAAPLSIIGPEAVLGQPGSGAKANPGVSTVPLIRTTPDSWAESDPVGRPARDPSEKAGPLIVGAAASIKPAAGGEKPTPRLVVFSSPLLADNPYLARNPTNLDLLMNSVFWLRGRPELRGLPGKTHESLMFSASPNLRGRLVLVPTLMAMVVVLGLGVTIYLSRRD